MMPRILRPALLALVLMLGCAFARADQQRDALLDKAVVVSQAARTMEVIGAAIDRNILDAPQFANLEARVRDRIAEVMRRAFAPERYVARVRSLLSERLTDDALRNYIDAMAEPVALKAQGFEMAGSLATPAQVQQFARLAAKERDYNERMTLMRRLDQSSGGSEMLLAITMHSMLSSAEMIRRIEALRGSPLPRAEGNPGPGARRATMSKAELAELANAVRPRIQRESLDTMMFIYQPLSLLELSEYVEVSERPSMRSVALAMNDALGALFLVAQQQALEQLLLELQGKGERAI